MTTSAANPGFAQLLRSPVMLLAFGFGSGLSPKAPGTAGTVVALLIWPLLAMLSPLYYGAVLVVATILGCYLCEQAAERLGVHDHGGIVWDEFVGLWITLFAVPVNLWYGLIGFALFRLFDILKPWPIGWLDKRVPGGAGIMIDDIVAGIMAALCLVGIRMTGVIP